MQKTAILAITLASATLLSGCSQMEPPTWPNRRAFIEDVRKYHTHSQGEPELLDRVREAVIVRTAVRKISGHLINEKSLALGKAGVQLEDWLFSKYYNPACEALKRWQAAKPTRQDLALGEVTEGTLPVWMVDRALDDLVKNREHDNALWWKYEADHARDTYPWLVEVSCGQGDAIEEIGRVAKKPPMGEGKAKIGKPTRRSENRPAPGRSGPSGT